jgi:DNA primase
MLSRKVPSSFKKFSEFSRDTLPDSFIQEVRSRVSLQSVIAPYVTLKKAGSSLVGLCPFHNEKSPSFSVSEEKGFYHCFGCGQHGDSIKFLMRFAGLSFRESMEELARSAGVSMPVSDTSKPVENYSSIYERLELAHKFFRHCLRHTDAPKEYLKSRSITPQTVKEYSISYAPAGWQSLQEPFGEEAYATDQDLVKSSLVREKDGRRYDVFRDRLMFAIRDTRGRIVGFGGRSMDGSTPKYLNSPDSPVFDKSSIIYGFHEARSSILAEKCVIVVEGYMDVAMMGQSGIRNVVATMGTACTPKQIERLCAVSPLVIFTFDGDAAGQRAAWRAMENSLPYANEDHEFRFCILPDGMDPDDMILKQGVASVRSSLTNAYGLHDFFLKALSEKHNTLVTPEDRARFVAEGLELLRRLPYGSAYYGILKADITKISQAGVAYVATLAKANRRNFASTDLWSKFTEAVTRFPCLARDQVTSVVDRLTDHSYALIEREDFFNDYERSFWENFLILVDLDSPPDVPPSTTEELLMVDLIKSLSVNINAHMINQQIARVRSSYLKGEISESEHNKARAAILADRTKSATEDPEPGESVHDA